VIPHNSPSLGAEEQLAAARVIHSRFLAQGPEVSAFENELFEFLNLPSGHAVAVSSGSAALFLALWALDSANKLIGLPVYACSALRNAVELICVKVVNFDCAIGTPNLNPLAVSDSSIDVLIAPFIFGLPVTLPSLDGGLRIVEDIAQSLGAVSESERIGLRGDICICSFYATKMIATGGQGVAVVSRHKALIDKVRDYRHFDSRDGQNSRLNFQMTDL